MSAAMKTRPEAGQRFPFIPLPRAIDRARELYRVANGHDVPFSTAVKSWGYAEKSSGGSQTCAALKLFGLLDDVSGSEVRKVKLTESALRIVRDPRDISPDRDKLLREAAVRPKLHADVWAKFGGMPPSDEALKAYLMIDRGLKDEAAPDFIREFTVTMAYAKVTESGTIQDIELEQPDGELPVSLAPVSPLPSPIAVDAMVERSLRRASDPTPSGARQEIFTLEEGDVVLTFPSEMSAESYEDLEAYLKLFLKKAKRRSGAPDASSTDDK